MVTKPNFYHLTVLYGAGGIYEDPQDSLQHRSEYSHALRPQPRLELCHDEGRLAIKTSSYVIRTGTGTHLCQGIVPYSRYGGTGIYSFSRDCYFLKNKVRYYSFCIRKVPTGRCTVPLFNCSKL